MKVGTIAFNTPTTMELKKTKTIRLLLSPNHSVATVRKAVGDKSNAVDTIKDAKVKFSERMEAELTGDGFKITPISNKRQAISSLSDTQWQWDVTATEPDTHYLHLTLNAIVISKGETLPATIQTYDQSIEVHVSFPDRISTFVGGNWQWLWTTLALPIGGWLWKRKGKSDGGTDDGKQEGKDAGKGS